MPNIPRLVISTVYICCLGLNTARELTEDELDYLLTKSLNPLNSEGSAPPCILSRPSLPQTRGPPYSSPSGPGLYSNALPYNSPGHHQSTMPSSFSPSPPPLFSPNLNTPPTTFPLLNSGSYATPNTFPPRDLPSTPPPGPSSYPPSYQPSYPGTLPPIDPSLNPPSGYSSNPSLYSTSGPPNSSPSRPSIYPESFPPSDPAIGPSSGYPSNPPLYSTSGPPQYSPFGPSSYPESLPPTGLSSNPPSGYPSGPPLYSTSSPPPYTPSGPSSYPESFPPTGPALNPSSGLPSNSPSSPPLYSQSGLPSPSGPSSYPQSFPPSGPALGRPPGSPSNPPYSPSSGSSLYPESFPESGPSLNPSSGSPSDSSSNSPLYSTSGPSSYSTPGPASYPESFPASGSSLNNAPSRPSTFSLTDPASNEPSESPFDSQSGSPLYPTSGLPPYSSSGSSSFPASPPPSSPSPYTPTSPPSYSASSQSSFSSSGPSSNYQPIPSTSDTSTYPDSSSPYLPPEPPSLSVPDPSLNSVLSSSTLSPARGTESFSPPSFQPSRTPSYSSMAPSPPRSTEVQDGDCQGECVPFYLCKDDGSINEDGEGLIDIKIPKDEGACPHYLDKCCFPSNKVPAQNYTPPTPTHDPWVCGERNPEGVGFKITGDNDNEASYGEFPWMAAILRNVEVNEGVHIKMMDCGGSIIHPQVVLTAAHCVKGKKNLLIRAGEWDSQTEKEIYPTQEREVLEVIIHEGYYGGALFNDVALLVLETPLESSPVISTICLPEQGENMDNRHCLSSGWGKDVFGKEGRYQSILKRVELDTVPRDICQEELRKTRLSSHFKLHDSFICAGGKPGKDTCKGDGGGPLVCPSKDNPNTYVQAGIVAWGIGCGNNTPAVYANLPLFREWIDLKLTTLKPALALSIKNVDESGPVKED